MPRSQFPYQVPDISSLARSLIHQWSDTSGTPGHVQMLNMLAKAAGYTNFQHFRTQPAAAPSVLPRNENTVEAPRVLHYFGSDGRLATWPSRRTRQIPCLWAVWSQIPPRCPMTERQINDAIRRTEAFGDHVLLRRELVNAGLLTRKPDGSVYLRIERQPPMELLPLLAEIARRSARR